MSPAPGASVLSPRARALYNDAWEGNARFTDRLFVALMLLQWLAGIVAAAVVSPRTWIGATDLLHLSVPAAVFGGGALTAASVLMAILYPGRPATRHVIAVAQMLWSALLIHLTGGRIETHFHVFGSLAFLSFYRDWRVLVTAVVVVALDHVLRGVFAPQSVFGALSASRWRPFEHAGWVVFESFFLVIAGRRSIAEMRAIAARRADLEESKASVEEVVRARTAELDDARRAAEAANHSKSEFLANMSHEIRTPMTAILGYADLMLDPSQSPSDRLECVQTLQRNGEHLLVLLNDILDLSKIEAGRLEVERMSVNPCSVVAEVTSLMSARAREKHLEFAVRFDGPVPAHISTDPTRLRQILMNLVGNAIKFTDRGSVSISVGLATPAADSHPVLRFRIADSGIGVAPEHLDRLFDPFMQADSSTTRRFGGSGLGLPISLRLAERLGGGISVESEPGRGSVFTATIETGPLDGVPMADNVDDMRIVATNDARAKQPVADPQLSGRILLAEDGPDNQRLIAHVLRNAGAEVVIAENGRLAVDMVRDAAQRAQPFDLILMDMQMPELDGYGAASLLRSRGCTTPIIALTAHAMAGDRRKCIAAGCDDYVTKPIDRSAMLHACALRLGAPAASAPAEG